MKKSLFLLAAVAFMASCAQKDVKNDVIEDEIPIGFVPAFMEKTTKANAGEMIISGNTNTFNVDGNTFEVWGWKTNTQGTTKVFDNQLVTYSSANVTSTSTTGWRYTPIKYWDRKASYIFYATAPHNKFTMANESNTDATLRTLTASGVPSVQILADMNGSSQITTSTTTAIDYLVAAAVNCAAGVDNQGNADDKDVAFTFSHILTKLTVKVKTIADFDNTGDTKPQLKLTGLKIKLNGMAQNYAQKTAGSVNAGVADKDAWTNAITTAIEKVCFKTEGSVTDLLLNSTTAQEVASYFVAPTTTGTTGESATAAGTATVTVTANYDIYYSDNVVDHCETPETTVTNLTSFVQNTHNILTVTISPTAILFDVQTVNGFNPEDNINQDVD